MKTKQFLSELFKMAWVIRKSTGKSFSECLRKAWMNCKLKIKMLLQVVEFYYQKINGEVRQAFGTLQTKHMQPAKENRSKSNRKQNETCLLYWDVEKKEFRQYKLWNIIRIV